MIENVNFKLQDAKGKGPTALEPSHPADHTSTRHNILGFKDNSYLKHLTVAHSMEDPAVSDSELEDDPLEQPIFDFEGASDSMID